MHGPQTYQYDSLVLDRDSLRLLQIIRASDSLHRECIRRRESAKAKQDARDRDFSTEVKRYTSVANLSNLLRGEEVEANRIILNLAVVIRNRMDLATTASDEEALCSLILATRDKFEGPPPVPFPETPSAIWRTFSENGIQARGLGVRDTCNKIIHAKGVEWSRKAIKGSRTLDSFGVGRPLNGFLFLYGERPLSATRDEVWVCMVNVEEFCLHANDKY